MRTITYTYDEMHPKNKDYLIAILADEIDDGGASYESMIKDNMNCPYNYSSDCYNEHFGNEYATDEYEDGCIMCKRSWLNREVDSYPSDDHVWEEQDDE